MLPPQPLFTLHGAYLLATRIRSKHSVNAKLSKHAEAVLLRINLLSIKPLFLSTTYVVNGLIHGRSKGADTERLEERTNSLKEMAKSMYNGERPDDMDLHNEIVNYVTEYVDIFYSMSSHDRKRYMRLCMDDPTLSKVTPYENLLIIPAFMAEIGKPKEYVVDSIVASLYRKPLIFIYEHGNRAYSIDRYLRSMAVSGSSEAADAMGKLISEISGFISESRGVVLDPQSINAKSADILSSMLEMKDSSNIRVFDYIAEKIMPTEYRPSKFMRR